MRRLGAYIAQAPRKPLPPAVLEKTKHHVLDTIAAMVSGSRLPPGRKAISFASTLGGAKEACVIGSSVVTAAANAALANGMLAHAAETLPQPGCVCEGECQSSVSSAWASMPLASAAFAAAVTTLLPITQASLAPPSVLAKEIAFLPGGSREPDTIAAMVSSTWCLVFSSTAGGNGLRGA